MHLISSLEHSSVSSLCDLDELLQQFTKVRILGLGNILKRDLESRGGDNYCIQVFAWCLYGGIALHMLKVLKEQLPWTLLKFEDEFTFQRIMPVSEMAKESILHVLVGNLATDVVSSNIGFCVYA